MQGVLLARITISGSFNTGMDKIQNKLVHSGCMTKTSSVEEPKKQAGSVNKEKTLLLTLPCNPTLFLQLIEKRVAVVVSFLGEVVRQSAAEDSCIVLRAEATCNCVLPVGCTVIAPGFHE